jgi:4-hydroxythreonine-4-phosphate dehydrogenase
VAYEALQAAVAAAIAGQVQGLCTLPINKLTIQRPGFAFPGHTEYLGEHFARAGQRPLMLFVHGGFRLACLTAHIPLAQVPSRVTQGAVQDALLRLAQALQTDFGATHPRIAVLGLNPHAGDGGLLGSEEQAHIAPAIQAVQAQGLAAEGPFPPDGFFTHRHHLRYDATLAMYHDQGLIPFKALTHGHGVNFTAGLGLARTSPDHGTAYDIAGTGSADPTSFFNSLALLRTVLAHRGQHVA